MVADRGRQRVCRPRPSRGMHCGRHHSRSDDARDGWISVRRRDAKASSVEANPYHRRHRSRSYDGGSCAAQFRDRIGPAEGDVQPDNPRRARSPGCGQVEAAPERAGDRFVMRILYVEDNEDNVYMLKLRFELEGFEVLVAENGETGCATALAEQPDIIIMDLDLPVVDGW